MTKADALSGTILGPNGEPVSGAVVALCTGERGAILGELTCFMRRTNSIVVRSDEKGLFTHRPQRGGHTIIVVIQLDSRGYA